MSPPPLYDRPRCRYPSPLCRGAARGQSLAEFALLAPIVMLVIMIMADFGRAVIEFNALTAAARVGAQYASTFVDPTTGDETGVELCSYDNITPSNNATLDPLGECASVLTQTLAVAPQVPRGDIALLHVERNGGGSGSTCQGPDNSGGALSYTLYCLTLSANFHPVTGIILGGRAISITVSAQYLAQ